METFAVYITLCVTVLVPTCSGTSTEASSATSIPGTSNQIEVMYSVFDKPQTFGEVSLLGIVFNVTCDEGYNLDGYDVTPMYTRYVNGTWAPTMPECKRLCKPLQSLTVDVQCEYKGKEIDCNKPVPIGTEATGHCKMGYLPTKRAVNASTIVCGENGQWSEIFMECEAPACGRKNSTDSVSSWLVVINRKDSTRCLGTLISPHIVLTSGRCMYSENELSKIPQTFDVTVGIDVASASHDKYTGVTVNVRDVEIHPQYFGEYTGYALNLALLDLETSVPNMPACVDWGCEFDVPPEQKGMVTAVDSSSVAYYIQYEYFDYVSCVSSVESSDRHYLTESKLCIKRLNGTRDAANGFIRGSGFMYEHNGIHYVKGVLSNWFERGIGSIYLAMNLTDIAVIQWIFHTKQSFDAFHDDK